VQRKRNPIAVRERIDGGASRRVDPVIGDPVTHGLGAHRRILGVEEHLALRLKQALRVRRRCGRLDAV